MRADIEIINRKIEALMEEKKKIQSKCTHDHVKTERRSNTGHLSEVDDSWWINIQCLDCGKHMTFDSKKHPEQYRKYT